MVRLALIAAFALQSVGGPLLAACAAERKACAMRAKSCCSRHDAEPAGEAAPCCCSKGKPTNPPRPEQPKPSPHEGDAFAATLLPTAAVLTDLGDNHATAPAAGATRVEPLDHHTRQAVICRWTN